VSIAQRALTLGIVRIDVEHREDYARIGELKVTLPLEVRLPKWNVSDVAICGSRLKQA
jgi:hypothetical protein